jgi:hypothetical protein
MRTVEQERYEAIFRAIGKPVRNGILLCIGATIVVATAFGVVSALFGPDFPRDWPSWVVYLVLMIPFGIAVLLIPNFAQLLVINGRTARAIEAFNVVGLGELAAYMAATGRKPPTLLNDKAARRWLKRGEGYGTRLRIRILIWAGELDAASETIAGMRPSTPAEAFHQALLRQVVEFVATGTMDLSGPRAALERISPGPERDLALTTLAMDEARLDIVNGDDHLQRLADARAQVAELPKGASIRDRFVANMPSSVATFAVIAVIIWVVQFS